MVATILLGLWLTMTVAPATPIARVLGTWMVEKPAAWLARLTRGHIVVTVTAFLVVWAAASWLDGELLGFLGMGTPDMVAWAVTFDIATYADVAAAIVLASSTMRMRGLASRVVNAVRRPAARHRRARKGLRPPRPTPSNDDEDGRTRLAA